MDANYWTRARGISRRGFLRGAGLAAGGALLAACGGTTKSSKKASATAASKGASAKATSTPQPVRGGTLTVRMPSDVSLFDYAYEHT